MEPTPQAVAGYLGQGDDNDVILQAQEHLPTVTAFVEAYTRGRGFVAGVPKPDVAAVIVSACARLVHNPTMTTFSSVGPFTERPGTLEGFTLPELAVLHRYRRRAA